MRPDLQLRESVAGRASSGRTVAPMASPLESPHVALRSVCDLSIDVVNRVPDGALRESPRSQESREVRSTSGGGGRSRADLLDDLSHDSVIVMANLTLLVNGVADCLQIAAARDNAVNTPALSSVLRPAMEVAGQVTWLFSDNIDGHERGRRYLIWRFSDLRHQRHVLGEFRPEADEEQAALKELDAEEQVLLDLAASAKWPARGSTMSARGDHQAAALLNRECSKPEPMPKINELVRLVTSSASVYSLLSVPSHGRRFGMLHDLEVRPSPHGRGKEDAQVGGFGVPPNLAIGLACLAVDTATRSVAGWNRLDSGRLHQRVIEVLRMAGIT